MKYLLVTISAISLLLASCNNPQSATSATEEAASMEFPKVTVYTYSKQAKRDAESNIALIEAVHKELESAQFPLSKSFTKVEAILPEIAEKIGRENMDVAGAYGGSLLYQSDGQNYKIAIFNSGDCYIVKDIAPELIDPKRSVGPIDCLAYGKWSEGVASRL